MPDPDEAQALALSLVWRLKEGSLPPDDAYAWTRIICQEVIEDADETDPDSARRGTAGA